MEETPRKPNIPTQFAACTVCRELWLRLTGSAPKDPTFIGSFEQGLSDGCPTHTPLLESFRDSLAGSRFHDTESEDIGIGRDTPVTLISSLAKGGVAWRLLLANTASPQNSAGQGRILDPDWVDIAFLRECKRKCLQTHREKCKNPMRISSVTPMLLIDVQHNCIVSGDAAGPYVALSYVWGTSDSPRRSNVPHQLLPKLRQPNGLDSLEAKPYMSPAICRAIAVTALIGERWLWVDALCVPQGNFDKAAKQINMMGAIFGGAVVTIISADGDAESGLLGLEGVSPSRKLDQQIIPFGSERIIVGRHTIFSWEQGSPYQNRAWTYQEFKMSPRTIWFLDKLVSWRCQCSVWDEELMPDSSFRTYIDPRPRTILAGIPDVESIGHILSDYNHRQLTYQEDALLGIQGFLSVLSRAFEGGFLWHVILTMGRYGLPETHFDRFLGWQPCWGHTNLQRRVRSDRSSDALIGPSELPSWSWIGWHGLIDTANRYDATNFNSRCSMIAETIPIVTWYTGDSPTDTKRRRIRPTFLESIPKFKEAGNVLPSGWTKFEIPSTGVFPGEPNIYPDGCGDYLYSHANIMKVDEEMRFYYPFPVADITEDTPPRMPPQTAYLFCETQKARLHATPRQKHDPLLPQDEMEKFIMDLRDNNNTLVGKLHLHNKEQLSLLTGSNRPGENSPGNKVEVVAISKRREYTKTWKEELERYDHPITAENLYVVLWVEWIDRVAYRLASGTVKEKAWEKLNLENVSLVLG
ncbi:heterokaryon incompatibility protein-domain-containing protein [Xylaria cf. heliscus]|nr:heterokaryon incompatibility protein-domain-containing protein [Xylaria cf. heliscus]